MTKFKRLLFLIKIFLIALFCSPSTAMESPWSVSPLSPAFDLKPRAEKIEEKPVYNPLIWAVKGFQKHLSPVDGDRCRMYPTCSAYSIDAIRKYGTVKGFIMTSDRLLHEADESSYAPLIRIHGRLRYYDPVENNDFWSAK